MTKAVHLMIIAIQILITFLVSCCIYMLFAFWDNDFGFDGLFGLVLLQPIYAIILSSLSILICIILGLPIRLNQKIQNWWIKFHYISIIGLIVGLLLVMLSFAPNFKEKVSYYNDSQLLEKLIPNIKLAAIGWFMIVFSLLHTYPSFKFLRKIKSIKF